MVVQQELVHLEVERLASIGYANIKMSIDVWLFVNIPCHWSLTYKLVNFG